MYQISEILIVEQYLFLAHSERETPGFRDYEAIDGLGLNWLVAWGIDSARDSKDEGLEMYVIVDWVILATSS